MLIWEELPAKPYFVSRKLKRFQTDSIYELVLQNELRDCELKRLTFFIHFLYRIDQLGQVHDAQGEGKKSGAEKGSALICELLNSLRPRLVGRDVVFNQRVI